ncbi:MAG: FxsA family protein [Kiloniellales bacterium]|nr:FxsA family protein [Kiloniellales bacterium]
MAIFFLALFIGLPLVEIYFLIEVGSLIGALPTIVLCIITAVLGTAMLRIQGLGAMQRVRQQLEQEILPERELVGGLFLLIAGLFLLTPGFFTDALGFVFLVPPFRSYLAGLVLQKLSVRSQSQNWQWRSPSQSTVIEGEFEEVPEKESDYEGFRHEDKRRLGQ